MDQEEEDIAGEEEDEETVSPEADAELVKATPLVAHRKDQEPAEIPGEDEGQLAIDVYQSADEVIVESPLAGVAPEDIDIAITSESVTIRGKRERERRIKDEDYIYQECYWGKFSSSVSLPHEVDADKAEASVKNGVLIITIPKLNRSKSKKLKVRA